MNNQKKDIYVEEELTEKQKRILMAATEIFAEKGFAATSTREIAKKAEVAEGTIFRHYKTKKELLLSIVTPLIVKIVGPLILKDLNKVWKEEHKEFEGFLRAMIKNRQQFLEKNMRIIQIFLQEIPFHAELREQFIEQIGIKVVSRFVEIIEYYQSEGQLIKMPAVKVLRLIGSTIMGYFATKYILASKVDWNDQEEIDDMIRFLLKGLAPDK